MFQEGKIISHIRLFIPKYRQEIPFQEVSEWAAKVYAESCARGKKTIHFSDKDFWKDKTDTARAFRDGLKRAFETVDGIPARRILDKLPVNSAKRCREMVLTSGPWLARPLRRLIWQAGGSQATRPL